MFENYINDLTKNSTVNQSKPLTAGEVLNNPLFNPDGFRIKLSNMDNLTDRDLYNLIKENYETILSDIFMKENPSYIELFTNSRFLSIMIQVMSSIIDVPYNIRVYCNKLAYDYLTYNEKSDDKYITQLFLSLSKTVNKMIIPTLIGLGLSEELASYLALARYSSLKEMVNVKRLNFVIMTSSTTVMTEQMIVNIYCKLFTKCTTLFEGTMFNVFKQHEMNEDMDLIYSTISLAVLDVLNSMTTADIRSVLMSYAQDYSALYKNTGVRFPIESISYVDYGRILDIVDALKAEQIYVP